MPRADAEPFTGPKGFDIATLNRKAQTAAALLFGADSQVSDR
jgi:hypothetical protein